MEWLDSLQETIAKSVEEVRNIDMRQLLDLDTMMPGHRLDDVVIELDSIEQYEKLVRINVIPYTSM
jgi:hypothetical protein